MKLPRRQFLHLALGATAVPVGSRVAWAESYPTRPITIVVPYAAGSVTDIVGRIVADHMRVVVRQPIIIENVTGADGNIGIGRVARTTPDGYTIGIGTMGTNVLNGAFCSLSYNLLSDLTPIAPIYTTPFLLYGKASLPAKDLKELIAWLKANPDKASAGVIASSYRMLMAFLQRETGTRFTLVPYRGVPAQMQDLVAGQIDFFFDTPVQLPLARAGTIKAFVVTSDARLVQAPGIPTVGEMGLPSMSFSIWAALFAPKGVPKDIINKLNAAIVETLADSAVRSRLLDLGLEPYPRQRQTPEALDAIRKADAKKWWPIIKELGIRAE
jgi:tripartite-type tricarboxylate transporter receptor subunit TctC